MSENQLAELTVFEKGMSIFSSDKGFVLGQKMANALASSTIVPKDYQGNAANALIAVEMASRLGTSPLMVMQNLYIVNGRPAWSSQYIVAMINSSGKYRTELQYELTGSGDDLACYAWVVDHNNHKVVGPTITMKMAKAEGWVDKNGSKWKTMPEVMIRYRAASFFGRLHCPNMIMGLYSRDEVIELNDDDYTIIPQVANSIEIDFPEEQEIHTKQETPTQNKNSDNSTASTEKVVADPGF
jgi:hypothetical protein